MSGPVGHIYLPHRPSAKELEKLARRLVTQVEVPLVLFQEQGRTWGVNAGGVFDLASEAEEVLGRGREDLAWVAPDLARLCAGPDAGDLVISGWRPDKKTGNLCRGKRVPWRSRDRGNQKLLPDASRFGLR